MEIIEEAVKQLSSSMRTNAIYVMSVLGLMIVTFAFVGFKVIRKLNSIVKLLEEKQHDSN